jgi:hypothetical protein
MFIVVDLASNIVTHTFNLRITAETVARVLESEGRNVIVCVMSRNRSSDG